MQYYTKEFLYTKSNISEMQYYTKCNLSLSFLKMYQLHQVNMICIFLLHVLSVHVLLVNILDFLTTNKLLKVTNTRLLKDGDIYILLIGNGLISL